MSNPITPPWAGWLRTSGTRTWRQVCNAADESACWSDLRSALAQHQHAEGPVVEAGRDPNTVLRPRRCY
jgi:hypothetical protein